MAVRNTTTRKAKETGTGKAVSARSRSVKETVQVSAGPAKAAGKEAEVRAKVLKSFHPGALEFLKEKLGLDLADPKSVDLNTVYDILQGKVTKPLEVVVTPLAYDRETRTSVPMPRQKFIESLRFVFPKKDGKPVAPDMDENRIFVASVPCRPYLEKAEGYEIARESSPAGDTGRNVEFTESQLMALEGIGVSRDRLYGGYNHLSRDEKADIAEGRRFFVDGAVRTDFGTLNVIGEAVLSTGADGKAAARFQSSYPEPRAAGTVLDLMGARRQGSLELDFFLRDSTGKSISDVNGVPLVNAAGENLVKYGVAMEPVVGYIHKREYDRKARAWKDSVEKGFYQVSVVEGNLYATHMKEVPELNPDGSKVTYRDRYGREQVQTRPEVAGCIVKDGKVYLDGQAGKPLEFASEEDRKNYLKGRPAVVKGATYHDFKANKDTLYDAVVVADNRKAGFGKVFTPSTSEELKERMNRRAENRRKQNFSIRI